MNETKTSGTDAEQSPKVSVIIPTYRRGHFLGTAIDSVLAQTYNNIEIIVVDDNPEGSSDRAQTASRVAPYVEKGVRYIQNARNLGGALARNAGIDAARGAYITFLDDDDVYRPEKLAAQVKAMERGGWDLCFMDVDLCAPDGRLLDKRTHDLPAQSDNDALLAAHLLEHLTPTATYLFRAEKLREIGGFDAVKTGHEFLLMLKAIERGLIIGYIPRSEVVQYIHPEERISTGGNKVMGENAIYAVKRRYWGRLTPAQRRAIAVRHCATLFFVHFKRRAYVSALIRGTQAVCISPAAALRLVRGMRRMMGADGPTG